MFALTIRNNCGSPNNWSFSLYVHSDMFKGTRFPLFLCRLLKTLQPSLRSTYMKYIDTPVVYIFVWVLFMAPMLYSYSFLSSVSQNCSLLFCIIYKLASLYLEQGRVLINEQKCSKGFFFLFKKIYFVFVWLHSKFNTLQSNESPASTFCYLLIRWLWTCYLASLRL